MQIHAFLQEIDILLCYIPLLLERDQDYRECGLYHIHTLALIDWFSQPLIQLLSLIVSLQNLAAHGMQKRNLFVAKLSAVFHGLL